MKKILLVVVLVLAMAGSAFALTQEELQEAKATLRQMERSLRTMKLAVNTALRGNILSLDLTAEQIQMLKDRYLTNKAELQTQYQELP